MRRWASPGFSLLEVVVALSITAIIVAIVAMSFAATFRAHKRIAEHMELDQTMSQTMDRLRLLLQAAYLTPYIQNVAYSRFETFDLDNVGAPYDAITFTTLANTSYKAEAHQSDVAEVTLFAVDEPPIQTPKGSKTLRRLRVRVGGEINSRFEVEGGLVYTLADHVTEFLLEYLTPEGEWKPEWDPADRTEFSPPCAVRVTLGIRGEDLEPEEASMIVPMQMTKFDCMFEDDTVFQK